MNHSPDVQEKQMDWWDATRAIWDGHRVTRLEWDDSFCYCLLRNGFLTLHKSDGQFYSWVVSHGDMAGTDWIRVYAS